MATIYKGWNAKILIEGVEVACCESASVEVAVNLEAYYCVGNKWPYAFVEGNKEITGSISRAWVNTNYLAFITGDLTTFDLEFTIPTSSTTGFGVHLYDCQFETGSLDIPADGILTEDYDFRASSIALV